MSDDRRHVELRALELIEKSLEHPEGERGSFIAELAGSDSIARDRALALLSISAPRTFLPTGGALDLDDAGPLPESIGSYRIEREIGRGGMGRVYLGRLADEDFEHVAAIKVVRTGLSSEGLVERLRAERRMLARLKHPNIAQFYDGGQTDDGEPYFVMEYVAGARLDVFISTHDVSLAARLGLFEEVCAAVAYAHRNLVVHRDLSPANIIVTVEGRAKLIDFGIAQSLSDESVKDIAGPRLTMTHGYAAPERLDGAPASTITDIFSLGVVLGELVEGVKAARRRDLDAIIETARNDSPEARYQSVDALLGDLRAYHAGRAVSAVNGGPFYALRRSIGRHPYVFLASGAAAIAVVSAGVVSTALFFRADHAERQATQRFAEVRDVANFMMFDLADSISLLDNSLNTRRSLFERSLAYLDALAQTTDPTPDFTIEIIRGYVRLADIAGNPATINLGDREQAQALLSKAEDLLQELDDDGAGSTSGQSARFELLARRAGFRIWGDGDPDAAIRDYGEAISLGEALAAEGHLESGDELLLAQASVQLGQVLGGVGRFDEAAQSVRAGLESIEKLRMQDPWSLWLLGQAGWANVSLGEVLTREADASGSTDYTASMEWFDRGVKLLREANARPGPDPLTRLHLVTGLLKRANTTCYVPDRVGEAVDDLIEAQRLGEGMLQDEPGNDSVRERLGHIAVQQVECYYLDNRPEDAVRVSEEAIASRFAYLDRYPDNAMARYDAMNTLMVVAILRGQMGDGAASCELARRGLNLLDQMTPVQQEARSGERTRLESLRMGCPTPAPT